MSTCFHLPSLGFTALQGLPGPYVKWFEVLGNQGLVDLIANKDNLGAQACCTVRRRNIVILMKYSII
jgi:inosine/xanthosine triphosphate pyrophosphatase family protein